LRDELGAISQQQLGIVAEPTPTLPSIPSSNPQKIALFRSLFRGREDVFARRWQNPKTGRSGSAPACANEWKHGACPKGNGGGRRSTCGECANQAFLPLTNDEIAAHLRGVQVVGVYPLLADETCWFLAADFDKRTWREDVGAFVETCTMQGVPIAIERSRSGKTDMRIYDYVDGKVPVLRRMFEKRLRGYRAIGYNREEQSGLTPEI